MSVSVSMPQLGESVTEGPSRAGSRRRASGWRRTSRCSRSPQTRSTPRFRRRWPGSCAGSPSPRTRPSRSAPNSRLSTRTARQPRGGGRRRRGRRPRPSQLLPPLPRVPPEPGGRRTPRWPGARRAARSRARVPVPGGGRVPGRRGAADRRVPAAGCLRGGRLRVAGRSGPESVEERPPGRRRTRASRAARGPAPAGGASVSDIWQRSQPPPLPRRRRPGPARGRRGAAGSCPTGSRAARRAAAWLPGTGAAGIPAWHVGRPLRHPAGPQAGR